MKTRILKVAPEAYVLMLSDFGAWVVGKNRLPEDSRLVSLGVIGDNGDQPYMLTLGIQSSMFRDDDPDELPSPTFVRHHTKKEA